MRRTLAMLALLALAGCGGGGSNNGENGQLSLTLSPSPLNGYYYPADLPATLTVNAQVSGSVSNSTVYVVIGDPGSTFATGPVTPQGNGPSSYQVSLKTMSDLSIGVHSSTLQIRVCGDAQCQNQLGSASLPYNVTVKTPTVTTAPPNPFNIAAITGGGTALHLQINGAATGKDAYALISDSANTFSTQPATLTAHSYSSDSYQTQDYDGVIGVQPNLAPKLYTGNLTISICADAACRQVYQSYPMSYSAQVLSIVAGQPGVAGSTDGTGSAATFSTPTTIGLDSSGNLYVADKGNDEIRKITPARAVSTVLRPSSTYPVNFELTADAAGNVFFDGGGKTAKLATNGTVSTYSGTTGEGIAVDKNDTVYYTYVANSSNGSGIVVEQTSSGTNSSLPTNYNAIRGIALDGAGNIYISNDTQISKVSTDNGVSTLISNLYNPDHMAVESSGNLLVVTYTGTDRRVSRVTPSGTATVVIPSGVAYANNLLTSFNGIAVTSSGDCYLVDESNHVILQTKLP